MPTIRDRIVKRILKPELEQMDNQMRTMWDAYLQGPFEEMTSPDVLLARLREQTGDEAIIRDLVDRIYYENIGSLTGYGSDTDAQRTRAVDESRRQWVYGVVPQDVIWIWTNFGFGEDIIIRTVDEKAQPIWDEFWNADRNQSVLASDKIQNLSYDVLVDGEVFLPIYTSIADGLSTIRTIDPKEITAFVTEPRDRNEVLFYKRTWTARGKQAEDLYYPDWLAALNAKPGEDRIGDDQRRMGVVPKKILPPKANVAAGSQTNVLMLPILHNCKDGLRGWPLMTAGAPWVREHKRFRENRAAVSAATAMYVNKLKAQTGSRGIDALRSQIQSSMVTSGHTYETNPAAPAGSTWLENEAADLQRLGQGTAAGDAKVDGEGLLMMAGLGGGLYPHFLGAGDSYRLATATAMEAPVFRQFSRYQAFWAAQFRKMVRIVLEAHSTLMGAEFTSYDAVVSTDRLVEADLQVISGSIHNVIHALLVPAIEAGLMPKEVAQKILASLWRIVLEALQVRNAVDIASDEAFMTSGDPVMQVAQAVQRNVEEGVIPASTGLDWAMKELAAVQVRVKGMG